MLAKLETETMTYVSCPHCGKRAGRIDHLFGDRLPRSWGPWYCDECGGAYEGTVVSPTEIAIEKRDGRRKIDTLDLLMIPARAEPVYLVLNSWRWEGDEDHGKEYFYEEHTCPTNWTDQIEAFILDGDADPHGVAQFVRTVDAPEEPDGGEEYDFQMLFPEAFDAPTIDGNATVAPHKPAELPSSQAPLRQPG